MPETAEPSLRGNANYARFWLATSVSDFGTYVSALAIQILIVVTLHGTAGDVGLVSAARWLPYMLLGLIAGALIDRVRRRPVLITADFARAAVLTIVAVLAWTQHLSIWILAALMMAFGLFSLAGDAAAQAFVPRLVPPALLTPAHARIDQSAAVAQASGPALAGALVAAIGAASAIIIDAASYLFSGLLLLTVRANEPRPAPQQRPNLLAEMAEGLAWVYRHAKLAPFALNTHAWFICSGVASAVLVPFAVRTLNLNPLVLGFALSLAGVGALVGSSAATNLGQRFGAGRTIIATRALISFAYVLIALAAGGAGGILLFGLGQFMVGLSMGASNSNEMGYRQAVTPDRLQGRMNATMRSINRAMIVVAAPLGGLMGEAIGYRLTLWIVAAGFFIVALTLGLSRFRTARLDETAPA